MSPVYEYKCTKCGNVFEEIHKVDDRNNPLSEPCKECQGEVEMKIGTTGIMFGFTGTCTVQGHKNCPSEFKDHLKRIKKGLGDRATGIE